MASGYAKATGRLPAVMVHSTVGALHAAMGLRAALHENIPMVAIGESIRRATLNCQADAGATNLS